MPNNPQVSDPDVFTNASGNQLLAVAIILIPLSLIAVALRFWARYRQNARIGWDDWLLLPVLVGNISLAAVIFWTFSIQAAGFVTPQPPPGVNPLDFQDPKITSGKQVTWSIELIQCWTLTCTKISLLLLYRRIFFTGYKGAFHWASIILMVISGLWGFTFFLAFLLECGTHLSAWWTDIRLLSEYCKASLPLEIVFAVTDIAVDLAVFFLPLVMVSKLKMTFAKKVATVGMFCLGAFAIAAGLFRMAVMIEAIMIVTNAYQRSKTGATNGPVAAHAFWACIESAATLMAACIPVVYAPIRNVLRRKDRVGGAQSRTAYSRYGSGSDGSRRWPLDPFSSYPTTSKDMSMAVDEIPMTAAHHPTAARIASSATATEPSESDEAGSFHDTGNIRVQHTIEQTSTFADHV